MFLLPLAQVSEIRGEGDRDSRLQTSQDVSEATSAAFAGGERTQPQPAAVAVVTPGPAKARVPGAPGAVGTAWVSGAAGAAKAAGGTTAAAVTAPPAGVAKAGTATSPTSGVISVAATTTKSPGSGQLAAATTGTAAKDQVGSESSKAVAVVANITLEGVDVVLAGAASSVPESSSAAGDAGSSPDTGLNVAFVGSMTTKGPAEDKPEAPLVSTLQSEGYMCERDGSQKVSHTSSEAQKEKRERQEKDRKSSRKSSHHRRTSRHSSSKDKSRKGSSYRSVSGHRKTREDKKGKGRGSLRNKRHSSSYKSESRTGHKSRENRSSAKTGPVSKRATKIRSFFRSLLVRPTSKPGDKSCDRGGVDIVTKLVEKQDIETTVEKSEGLDFNNTIISETMEKIILETKSI